MSGTSTRHRRLDLRAPGLFEDSRRRVDLLALDRAGTLVVIELKRTGDGGHMELQALRYAAMVSTMTADQLVTVYSQANDIAADQARQVIEGWVEGSFEELSGSGSHHLGVR